MRFSIDGSGFLEVESRVASLRGGRPVLNGAALEGCTAEMMQAKGQDVRVRYRAPALGTGTFNLEAAIEAGGLARLRYWLEGLPDDLVLDSFGLYFTAVENLRAYLRNGYFSWDGSYYVQPEAMHDFEPYETRPETGYAMTQILPRQGSGSLVAGFDRHDRFQHTFTFDTRRQPAAMTALTLWDRKDRASLDRCESEDLVVFVHPEVEEALRDWARIVAEGSPQPPRLSAPPITGWCSWYNLYAYIHEENILHHLRSAAEVVRRERLPMRVFQIDDGFTPEMGDWLEVKPQFPRGMKPLLDDIRAAGFIPGLWIGPFMVGNRSRLYQEHPDWVVRDANTGGPLAEMKFYGEFRWHKRSEETYILDTTHPEAFDYLRRVFRTWRHEWGCEYFKTDFMHFGSHHGPDRAVWHRPGMTRIEIWHRTAEMIREEIGEALWLGCGCPLWASIGLVDGIRIGQDVGVDWRGNLSAQSLLRDQATRNFTNQLLWQTDPDCVLLRPRFHNLSESEVRSLAIFAGMSGGVTMTSDDLGELTPERLRLWKLILPNRRSGCSFPFLGQSELSYERMPAEASSLRVRHVPRPADPALVQVRRLQNGMAAVFIFNTGETPVQRRYSLESLGLSAPGYVYDWIQGEAWPERVEAIDVTLAGHDGALFFVDQERVEEAPERLD